MKYISILLIASAFLLNACNQGSGTSDQVLPGEVVENAASATGLDESTGQPRIAFARTEHDFGRLTEGEKVEFLFNFTNEGDADLLISNCYGSCGCTVPEWPSEPIPPGGKGAIKVMFDSSNRPGMNSKTVTVLANTSPRSTVLRIQAEVSRN